MHLATARLAVLVSGAVILVVETLATRLVAPYVGLTLESTAAAIGVALLGIAAGSSIGGRISDVVDPRRVAAGALVLGGLAVFAVRPMIDLLGLTLGAGPIAALLLVGFSTLPSVTALGAVGPAVTRARLTDVASSGSVIGSLSAIGTIGSLAGTFLTGFVLVAYLPTTVILIVAGSVCLLAAIPVATVRPTRVLAGVTAGAVALALAAVVTPGRCDVDTTYYCARVVADPDRPTGRILMLDDLEHSYVDLADPTHLDFAYVRRIADVINTSYPDGRELDAVHIGGGGFTVPRWLAATRPGSRSTVLELDPGVVRLGRAELGLNAVPGLDVRTGDARTGLRALPDASADVVIGDAFGARSVPWHLTTVEFLREVRRVLRPGGVYVLNVIDNDPLRFLAAETRTVATVLGPTTLLVRPDQLADGGGGNAVLAAGDGVADAAELSTMAARRGEPGAVLDPDRAAAFAADAPVLTDDRAPVDQLLNPYRTRQ